LAAALVLAALLVLPAALVARRLLRSPPDPLPRARLLLERNDAAAAEPLLRAAVERRPEDPVAWHLLGECLRLRGDADAADVAALRARNLAPGWDAPAVALAARALAAGRHAEARHLVERALDLGGDTAAVRRLRARLRADGADFTGAAHDLAAAANRPGGRSRDLLEAAQMADTARFVDPRADVPADLLDAAERRARQEGESSVLSAVARARGDVDDTDATASDDEGALRLALALDDAKCLRDALRLIADVRTEVGPAALRHAARALSPPDRVRLSALCASSADASPEGVTAREVTAHVAAARRAAVDGHGALAIAHVRSALLQRPDDPDLLLAAGMRLGESGDTAAVVALAEQLPGGLRGAAARRLLGWYHVGAEEPRRAATFLLPAADTCPDGRVAAALLRARERGPDVTSEEARAAATKDPGDAVPRLLLGLVAGHRGATAEACGHLAAALARDPSLVTAANDLAWWLSTRGDAPDRARPLAVWALHLAPDDPHVRHTDSEVRRRTSPLLSERTPR
jgi:Flp pilus assembly protein TadD